MKLKERKYTVLTVSAQPKFNDSLKALVSERTYFEMDFEESISSAKRRLLDRDYDILIINAPLPDEDGVRLAVDRSSGSGSAVLLLLRSEYYTNVFEQVVRYGVYTLPKPAPKQLFSQAFDWLESTRERLMRLEKKSVSLEDKMQEIRLVNRAKWQLISSEGLSEEEAHRFIEKQAMDRCVSKRTVAEEIISRLSDTARS